MECRNNSVKEIMQLFIHSYLPVGIGLRQAQAYTGTAFNQWSSGKNGFFAPNGETTDWIKKCYGVQKWYGPPLSPRQVWWGSWVARRL